MTHTPAPWSADYGDFDVFDERGACVARAVQGTRDDGSRIEATEHEANLNLIAAAPELLAGLKQIAHKQETGEGDFNVAALCHALVAKAEGKQQ